MNTLRRLVRFRMRLLAGLLFALGSLGYLAVHTARAGEGSSPPAGYVKYLVYMANGVYNPNDPNFTPPSGDFFFRNIMGFNDAQIAQSKADAITFFNARFGLDVANDPNVTMTSFMFDPRNNYRAYTISGMEVPDTGFVVRDGGWNVTIGPNSEVLHGAYGGAAGKTVPAGAAMVFGNYNILVERGSNTGDGEGSDHNIILHYQSHSPIISDVSGNFGFQCELTSPQFGNGFAQGLSGASEQLLGGLIKADIRNVLTFPAF